MKKKILVTGVILVLAMVFMGTCEAELTDEDAIEYVDVVYSKDGSQVTIYIDGVGEPVSKSQKRAMSRDLSMMSYDYLEVIFRNGGNISRSAWELGQEAGISGGGIRINPSGGNYGGFTGTQNACLFAGQKSGKTLFGVGKMTSSRNAAGTSEGPIIHGTTRSVTFSLAAIQTGLLIGDEDPEDRGVFGNSFTYRDIDDDDGYTTTVNNSSIQTLADNVPYPAFALPKEPGTITYAQYQFYFYVSGSDDTSYRAAILHYNPALDNDKPKIIKRTPRFMDGGRYLQPNGHVDTKTKAELDSYAPSKGAAFAGIVPLKFTTVNGSGGIFSFYLEIPVYMLDDGEATLNNGPGSERWVIRTGLGSDLYSLDDGVSSGGCVFMSSGVTTSDWLSIDWVWLPSAAPSEMMGE